MSSRARGMQVDHWVVKTLFERCFYGRYRTHLIDGAPEPIYRPPTPDRPGELHYTRDYVASALHETAHWCLAGASRRAQADFGYSYVPAAQRTPADQALFERMEVKTQAIEWFFAQASALPFRLSVDQPGRDRSDFRDRVLNEVARRLTVGLPPRAQEFFLALTDYSGSAAEVRWSRFLAEAEAA